MKKILIIAVALIAIGGACQKKPVTVQNANTSATTNTQTTTNSVANTNQAVANTNPAASVPLRWEFNSQNWMAVGTPSACAEPIQMQPPVDLTSVSHILYPGQTRGTDYKPHGGFRFNGQTNNTVDVTAPYDAQVVAGARYIEQGETQYLFDFQNRCGIQYRFDHLLALAPTFQALADRLPAAQPDDSRTTNFSDPITVQTGDLVATAVGFTKNLNVSVDFGTYDLRTKNAKTTDAAWASAHADEASQAYYGTCWIDYFSPANAALVRALPAGDPTSGKNSDYCE